MAEEVPGLAALNRGGAAQLASVSCGAAGGCSAGGFYLDGSGLEQLFVVGERGGTWGTAEEIPGLAALNQGVNAGFAQVSCAAAGACSAGGYYTRLDGSVNEQAFVVTEANGTWHTAETVPGTATLSGGKHTETDAVSCASAGNCVAGGEYWDGSAYQTFVAGQKNGTWGTAKQVPGTAALSTGGGGVVTAVSCASAGNCSAGGQFATSSGGDETFLVTEANGTWGTAEQTPGTAHDPVVYLHSLSCASAGNCSAGGQYTTSADYTFAFVVSQTNGAWGTLQRVRGLTLPHLHGAFAMINSVSCASPGNCSAGGSYTSNSALAVQAFAVDEINGTWGTAKQVPGSAALNTGGNATITSVSCPAAGTCSAVGNYSGAGGQQAFVVSETNGAWRTAEPVPGLAALNQDGVAKISSVSCASAGHCSGGGFYTDSSGNEQAFVVNET
jgi:hypothetical protein